MKQEYGHEDCPWKDHISVDEVSHLESKGPIVARARQPALMKGEHFCMQCDAHSMFVQDWDVKIMKQWMHTENEYAVLTTYIKDIGQLKAHEVPEDMLPADEPLACQTLYDGEGMIRNDQAANMYNFKKPKLATTWCAGLSFSKCHAELAVPNDPNLKQIFDGEEWGKAVRLWTNGYDMYAPAHSVVFHGYMGNMFSEEEKEDKRKAVWNFAPPKEAAALKAKELRESKTRLRSLLKMDGGDPNLDLGKYGLGTKRGFDEFAAFCGTDPRHMTRSAGEKCGDVTWVPWDWDYTPPAAATASAGKAPRKVAEFEKLSDDSDGLGGGGDGDMEVGVVTGAGGEVAKSPPKGYHPRPHHDQMTKHLLRKGAKNLLKKDLSEQEYEQVEHLVTVLFVAVIVGVMYKFSGADAKVMDKRV
jgi:hypothetical protein